MVTDEATLDCAVIDPGDESNTILDYLEDNRLHCRAVMLTPAPFDHVGAVEAVLEATGAKFYMCERELETIRTRGSGAFKPPEGTVYYDDGDVVEAGSLRFEVIATPGHTTGGVTLRCGDALFTGDTLFRGSCGRTDFPGGDMTTQLRSLRRLAQLEGDFEVYPGHAECSTLSVERAHNPYMRHAIEKL